MHVAIVFVNFGGYHWARLRAAEEACRRRGWRLTAIQVTNDELDHPWAAKPLHEVQTVTVLEGNAGVAARVGSLAAGIALSRVLARVSPDAVFLPGWSLPLTRVGLIWCYGVGALPIVMSESKEDDSRRASWREALKGMLVRRFSAALVGGRAHREYLENLGVAASQIAEGYDVVDNEYFSKAAAAVRLDPAPHRARYSLPERYFLASSVFVPKKNLFRLIEAYAEYRHRMGATAWQLVVLGDGSLRTALERERDSMGLAEHVLFPGFRAYNELPAFYALAQAFVHSSTTEQWGLVVNEAMASGLPVLVSEACGCARELVWSERNGFLFNPVKPHDLALLMERMTLLPESERAAMGRMSSDVISSWSPKRFGSGVVDAVLKAAGGPQLMASASAELALKALWRWDERGVRG